MFRARFAPLAVLVFGLLGLGASCNRSHSSTPSPASPEVHGDHSHGDAHVVADPSAVSTVSGLDVTPLSAPERELFWAVANDELSPCGDPHSVAVCGRDHLCPICLPALRFLSRRVQDGFPREELGTLVRDRWSRSATVTIHFDGSPTRGPATAPVTLVEFSDYECPHCGHAAPVLRDIEREFGDRLRVVQMHFPLSGHIHAMPAARAAVAAGNQGHFWEYHDLLFANQSALEQPDLERYATQLGLDLNRFRADQQAPATEAKVASDRREGERLQIDGTPTIYINGRKYTLPIQPRELREWIQDEIDNAGH